MWIMGNRGFLSIVAPVADDFAEAKRRGMLPKSAKIGEYLAVRARKAQHLREAFPGRDVATTWRRWADYPARCFVPRDQVAKYVAEAIEKIRYTNFKSSVDDQPLHDAYLSVWGVMNRFAKGAFNPKPKGKQGTLQLGSAGDAVYGGYDDGLISDDTDQHWSPRAGLSQG